MRVYFDACIAIYYVERHPVYFHKVCSGLFVLGEPDKQVVVSELVRLECLVHPRRSGLTELLARFDEFFSLPDLGWANLDRATFDLATDLRALHRLKTPDALHLVAALEAGCGEFWTNDLRLASAAGGRIRIVTPDGLAP